MVIKSLNRKIIFLTVLAGLVLSFISLNTVMSYSTSVYMSDDVTKKPTYKPKPTPTTTPMMLLQK